MKKPRASKAKTLSTIKSMAEATKEKKDPHRRGAGLKFNADSYSLIARFTSKTKISYAPNPKTPGSKSFDRYKLYEKAKTVGEALKHCKPADLLWEYERGYLKLHGGPMLDVPACMLTSPSEDKVVQILAKFRGPRGASIKMDPEVRKKLVKLSKLFGMDLDQIHEEAGKNCNNESADIQTARVVANEMARRKLEAKKKLMDKDVVEVLQIWGFAENESRQNVLPDGVKTIHSDTLGIIRLRTGGYRIFDPTTRYEYVTKLICKWFDETHGKAIPEDFGFTGININHNYAGRRHRDANNEGPSAIKALGSFTGGKLNYFPKDVKKPGRCDVAELDPKESIALDVGKEWTFFNGNNGHGVNPFKGERFSLVFFTSGNSHVKMAEKDKKTLTKLGFKVPTKKSMEATKAVSKQRDLAVSKQL